MGAGVNPILDCAKRCLARSTRGYHGPHLVWFGRIALKVGLAAFPYLCPTESEASCFCSRDGHRFAPLRDRAPQTARLLQQARGIGLIRGPVADEAGDKVPDVIRQALDPLLRAEEQAE